MRDSVSILNDVAAEWRDARHVYTVYSAILKSAGLDLQPCSLLEAPIDRSDEGSLRGIREWLTEADEKVTAPHIRQVLQHSEMGTEPVLRALILRYLHKEKKNVEDRYKLDYLVVQYLAVSAPRSLVAGKVDTEDVAYVLTPVLGDIPLETPRMLEPLKGLVERISACSCLRDLIRQHVMESGRKLKDESGEMYFMPSVLTAFARYNFLVRRAFVKLLHEDLSSIRKGLLELESKGVTAVNCSAAGFAEEESINDLRKYCQTWRNIFVADYQKGPSFQSIAEIRAAVEEALRAARQRPAAVKAEPKASKPDEIVMEGTSGAEKIAEAQAQSVPVASESKQAEKPVEAVRSVSREVKEIEDARARLNAAIHKAAPTGKTTFTVEQAIEAIGRQLSSANGSEAPATATVKLGASMMVLSVWELEAFVKKGPLAPTLQRAVAARAILMEALERGQRSGVKLEFGQALEIAQAVAAELQVKIGEAKQSRNLDGAVNLAASSKRLATVTAQAEKASSVAK